MIGQRIRWRHVAATTGERMFPERAGIARSVVYAPTSDCWRVLVEHSDGTFSDQRVEHMELDRDAPSGCDPDFCAPNCLGATSINIAPLLEYIVSQGLEERAAAERDPCATAIELLKLLQDELLKVGEARDVAERTCSELAIERSTFESTAAGAAAERDMALKRVDELTAEIEAAKKRKPGRPAGRASSEDAP